jgi:hypothetical protein
MIRRDAHNKVLPQAGVTCYYDTFLLKQTLIFQINGSAETPRLRQAFSVSGNSKRRQNINI